MPPRSILAALASVCICGLLFGVYAWNTYIGSIPQEHTLPWQSSWIAHPGERISQSYFRKKIYLAAAPRHAWVQVMAPDEYTLYVNGQIVGSESAPLRHAVGVYNITAHLKGGTNLLALAVSCATYRCTSHVAVEGAYEDWYGNRQPIFSDASWRVSPYRQKQPDGGPSWFEERFDGAAWTGVAVQGRAGHATYGRVPYHPWIFIAKSEGQWIWSPITTAVHSYFRYSFALPSGAREAWIRIATRGSYALLINGTAVVEQSGGAVVEQEETFDQNLEMRLYNITPFVRSGANVVALKVANKPSGRRFYADGIIVDPSGREQWFTTDRTWKSSIVSASDWPTVGYNDSDWVPSVALGGVTVKDGALTRRIVQIELPDDYWFLLWFKWCGFVLLSALGAIALWLLGAQVRVKISGGELAAARRHGAYPFLLATAILAAALLLSYDFRFERALPFRSSIILGSLGVLGGLQLLLSFQQLPATAPASGGSDATERAPGVLRRAARRLADYRYASVVGLLVLAGLLIRLNDVDYQPLGPDEATGMLSVLGIVKSGYPHYQLSDLMSGRESHSSELVGYPKALAVWLLGPTEFAARLPAVVFGTLNIFLVFLLGYTLFDQRVGALAAIVYTLLPVDINFAQFSRYLSQLQFFSVLAVYLWYRAVADPERLSIRHLYWTVAAFTATYLSWEGSAFLLPGLFVGLLAVRRLDFSWLRSKHLWCALAVVFLLIFFQFSLRFLNQIDRKALGSGLTDLNIIPVWLYPQYDPFVYFHSFLFVKNLQVISAAMLLGVLVCFRDRAFAYLNVVLLTPLVLTTHLLETQEFRHVYYLLPFLILSGVKSIAMLLDYLLPMEHGSS